MHLPSPTPMHLPSPTPMHLPSPTPMHLPSQTQMHLPSPKLPANFDFYNSKSQTRVNSLPAHKEISPFHIPSSCTQSPATIPNIYMQSPLNMQSKFSPVTSTTVNSTYSPNFQIPQQIITTKDDNPFTKSPTNKTPESFIIPYPNNMFYDTTTPINVKNSTPFYLRSPETILSSKPIRILPPPSSKNSVTPRQQTPRQQTPRQQTPRRQEQSQHIKLPNYSAMSLIDQEYWRNDFLQKFDKLRKPPYEFNIGEIDPNMSLESMHIAYESFVKVINKNFEVDNYFMFLFFTWAGIETMAAVFNFPIKGYTIFQLKRYETYRSLLNGLGDTYTDDGEVIPAKSWAEDYGPITKIIIMSIGNIIFFLLFRLISKIYGEEHADRTIDNLANKFYGKGDTVSVEKVINDVVNHGNENTGGFNIGGILSGIMDGDGLSGIGSLIGNLFSNGNSTEKTVQIEELEVVSPKSTYDDKPPEHVLSPNKRKFNIKI
jgi:hypothetical protein